MKSRLASVLMMTFAGILFTAGLSSAQFAGGGPKPGDVYKEFVYNHTTNNWRVTDPNVNLTKYPEAAAFLPNPVLQLNVDDLQNATRAEVVIDFWGGHDGTTGKRFRFNGNSWIAIPELHQLDTSIVTPPAGNMYMQQVNHLIPVPLSHLKTGVNTFEGTSGPNSWGWGQWGWYGVVLRVYYNPSTKTYPTGRIVSPQTGMVLTENPTVEAETSGSVDRVEFIAHYEGYDGDGDGVYKDWQRDYHRTPWTDSIRLRNHVGTATASPFQAVWNTQWLPDQVPGEVKLIARIRGTNGYWYVTDEVTGLSFERSQSVQLYKPTGVPSVFWVRAGQTKSCKVFIPTLDNAVEAVMLVKTWNGNEKNATFHTKVNGWTTPKYGLDHLYSYDVIPVPLSALQAGENTVSFYSATVHHGIEIMWPGPAILVRYAQDQSTSPAITGQPEDRIVLLGATATFSVTAGGAAPLSYQWKKNGVDIPGATGSSYTTLPTALADSGSTFSCTVSNSYGNATSRDAVLTVTTSSPPPSSVNVISNPGFESGTNPWKFYTNGKGGFDTSSPGYEGTRAGRVTISTKGTNTQLFQADIALDPNTDYELRFAAYSNSGNDVKVSLLKHTSPFTLYGLNKATVDLKNSWQTFTIPFKTQGFTAPVKDGRLMFWFSDTAAANDRFFFDNVVLAKKGSSTVLYPLTLDVSGSGGVALEPPGGMYQANTLVRLTATPAPGWLFGGWGGALSGDSPSAELTITGDTHVAANFVATTYTLTVTQEGQGTVTVDPSKSSYNHGELVTLTATPAPDWKFVGWNGSSSPATTWWDPAWSFRVPIQVGAAGHARTARPVEQRLNFTAMLNALGRQGAFAPESIRVVEINAAGDIIDPAVPFQFDPDPGFDALANAAGTLVFIMPGVTPSSAARTFHVYFDLAGSGIEPAVVPPQVVLTDNVMDEGQASYRIQTAGAVYYYHKAGGGLSSLVDAAGRDWISYAPTGGSAGSYRGIPNAVYPEGHFRPGSTASTSSIVSSGPIKTTIRSVTSDGRWEALWEFYPGYASMTMLKADKAYWFLYEGTPGGLLDSADYVVRSNGTQTPISTSWTGDLTNSAGEEWVYFTDPNVLGKARSLFLAQHQDDTHVDSYWPMNGQMTVFGFGRSNLVSYMTRVPNRFTIGLMDEAEYSASSAVIRSAVKDLTVSLGAPQGSAAGPLTLAMTENRSVTATFAYAPSHSLSTQVLGSGTVIPSPSGGSYPHGTVVQLTAAPSPGWQFTGWSGDAGGSANPLAITMDGDKAVTATFVESSFASLSVQTVGLGAVALNPPGGSYPVGTVVRLTATPSPGWQFSEWSGDLSGSDNPAVIVMDTSRNVTAAFGESSLPLGLVSDDFNTCGLDTSIWRFVNPSSDGGYLLEGVGTSNARLLLSVPAGKAHDPWTVNSVPRMMQLVDDSDFEIEVKFDSVPAQKYQMQGVIFEQDSVNWVRFDFHHDGSTLKVYATSTINGLPRAHINTAIPGAAFLTMRVKRTGNQWTQSFSSNGTSWVTAGSFTQAIAVRSVGPFAGNQSDSGNIPAYTAMVDYFFNMNSPIAPEDGGSVPQKTITTGVVGGGTIAVDPARAAYSCGETVQLFATPAPGWQFIGWSGDVIGTTNPAAVTVDGDLSVTATFSDGPAYTLSVEELGSGVVTLNPGGGKYPAGTEVQLTAAASPGWQFTGWSGHASGTTNPVKVTVNSNKTVAATFQEASFPPGIVSDDFNSCGLDTARWTFVNPLGDGSYLLEGAGTGNARLLLSAPAGVAHDPWTANGAIRMMQASTDSDFEIEVKFESMPSQRYQMQGVIVEQDATNWLRFDFHHDGSNLKIFAAKTIDSRPEYYINSPIAQALPLYMRVKREGNSWTQSYSFNGSDWINAGSFTQALAVTAVGPYVANQGQAGAIPAYTASIDYFFNTASPIVPEDGGSLAQKQLEVRVDGEGTVMVDPRQTSYGCWQTVQLRAVPSAGFRFSGWSGSISGSANPVSLVMDGAKRVTATFAPVPAAPVIDVWYGPHQVFGEPAEPQYWVGVLGNVSDPDGVAFLTYSLNGGPEFPLSMGPFRRLTDPGDFNVELDYLDLNNGINNVTIRALDNLGNQSEETITVEYSAGNTLPESYGINWMQVSDLQAAVQVVDGVWSVDSEAGVVRPVQIGYDRALAVGDLQWKDYEVTIPITVHGIDGRGYDGVNWRPSIGFMFRFRGHTDVDGSQPRWGYTPVGGGPWYEFRKTGGSGDFYLTDFLQLDVAHPANPVTLLRDVPYIWKARVQTIPGKGSHYSFKIWQQGAAEPARWQVTGLDSNDLSDGSLLLVAHYVDASFGNVTVTPTLASGIPVIDQVVVDPNSGFAVINWRTNVPSTTVLRYGLTGSYELGTLEHGTLKTQHSVTLPALTDGSIYRFEIAAVNGQGFESRYPEMSFRAGTPSTVRSDGFNTSSLDQSLWTFINPLGDGTVTMTGTQAAISVPAGVSHDVWSSGNLAPRIMQWASDTDFEIEVKFDSAVTSRTQMQGVIIEEDGGNFLRFDFIHDGSTPRIFAASFEKGGATTRYNQPITGGAPLYLRVKRQGNQWSQSYSLNGTSWINAANFDYTLNVASVGPFVANHPPSPGAFAPAFTTLIDYFVNTAAPPVP